MKLKLMWQTLIDLELPSGRASPAEEVAIALQGERAECACGVGREVFWECRRQMEKQWTGLTGRGWLYLECKGGTRERLFWRWAWSILHFSMISLDAAWRKENWESQRVKKVRRSHFTGNRAHPSLAWNAAKSYHFVTLTFLLFYLHLSSATS